MFKNQLNILMLTSLLITQLNAGVVILTEVPASVQALLQKARITLKELVEKHNAENPDAKHLLEIDDYVPHISLAYVSDKQLTAPDLEKEAPNLDAHLKEFTTSHAAMALKDEKSSPELVVWNGRKGSEFEKRTFDNSAILVIKMKQTQELAAFVAALDKMLESHPVSEKRKWPFNPHVTIGYLYHDKDIFPEALLSKVKPELEKCLASFDDKNQAAKIESIKLSTHDKVQKIYHLKS